MGLMSLDFAIDLKANKELGDPDRRRGHSLAVFFDVVAEEPQDRIPLVSLPIPASEVPPGQRD